MKKFVAGLMASVFLFSNNVAAASARAGVIDNVWVNSTPVRLNVGMVKKNSWDYDQHYVVDLRESKEHTRNNIRTWLTDVNGSDKSNRLLVTCGERDTFKHWASKGKKYFFNMSRENFWDVNPLNINGYWNINSK